MLRSRFIKCPSPKRRTLPRTFTSSPTTASRNTPLHSARSPNDIDPPLRFQSLYRSRRSGCQGPRLAQLSGVLYRLPNWIKAKQDAAAAKSRSGGPYSKPNRQKAEQLSAANTPARCTLTSCGTSARARNSAPANLARRPSSPICAGQFQETPRALRAEGRVQGSLINFVQRWAFTPCRRSWTTGISPSASERSIPSRGRRKVA